MYKYVLAAALIVGSHFRLSLRASTSFAALTKNA